MTKPKELSGIVFKFEYVAYLSDNLEDNLNIREFYTQSFKPEMIEEYFSECRFRKDTAILYNSYCFMLAKENDIWKTAIFDSVGVVIQGLTFIPTLSDFIDACINSNIELEWK